MRSTDTSRGKRAWGMVSQPLAGHGDPMADFCTGPVLQFYYKPATLANSVPCDGWPRLRDVLELPTWGRGRSCHRPNVS